jgi:hypothetical protein
MGFPTAPRVARAISTYDSRQWVGAGGRKELLPVGSIVWARPKRGQAAGEGEQRTRVMDAKDQALLALGKELQSQHYRFTTGTARQSSSRQ